MIRTAHNGSQLGSANLREGLLAGVRQWSQRAEMDQAVLFGVFARCWQLAASPVTILLVSRFMTPTVQGYYYTFSSLIALQTTLELGLYLVIINLSSHEWAHLRLQPDGAIAGEPEALSRLVSLGRLVFRWYAVASTLFIVGVGSAGYVFFVRESRSFISWRGPWVTLVVLTGFLLWMLPFNSILEGCNQVATVNRFRFSQAVLGSLALWVTLAAGGGLWAAAVWAAVAVARDAVLLLHSCRRFFVPFFRPPAGPRISWRREVWPMQWRLGVSGLFNYFAFSFFTPVMFHYFGAVVAGQTGMTWQVANGVQAMALVWIFPKVPRFGMLIAQRDYRQLDRLWLRTSIVSMLVVSAGALAVWLAVWGLNLGGYALAGRLLSPLPVAFFLLAVVLNTAVQCEVAYLRAHRREPILVMSVTSAALTGMMIWQVGSRLGPTGMAAGYLSIIALVAVPWATLIWMRCRSAWHQEPALVAKVSDDCVGQL